MQLFGESYASLGRVSNVIPVDVAIPGCPPTPTALLQGILAAITVHAPPFGGRSAVVHVRQLIVLGGGNTRSLPALWREWDLDAILREAYDNSIVLGGVSVSMICWFEFGGTDPGNAHATQVHGVAARWCMPTLL